MTTETWNEVRNQQLEGPIDVDGNHYIGCKFGTVQFRYGKGRVIVTTYQLINALATHPLAAAMLHDLVDYLASDACAPTLAVGVL